MFPVDFIERLINKGEIQRERDRGSSVDMVWKDKRRRSHDTENDLDYSAIAKRNGRRAIKCEERITFKIFKKG